MMYRTFLTLSLTLCALFVSVRGASGAVWLQVKSEHFTVVGDATETELRGAASRLELTRAAVLQVFPFLDPARGHALTAIIFADPTEYRTFKPVKANGNVDDAVLGYYLRGDEHDLIAVSYGPKSNTDPVLSHEYAHWLVRSNYPDIKLPPWIEEGFAEYVASLNVRADGRQTMGGELSERQATLRKNSLLESASFFATEPPSVKGGDQDRALFYAQAAATVHLIVESGTADMFKQLLEQIAGGTSSLDAVSHIYGLGPDKIAKNLGQYINAPFGPWILRPPIAEGAAPAISVLSSSRSELIVGDLLTQMGRQTEAEPYLRRSIAADKNDPAAHAALGITLAKKGAHADAAKELETALALGEAGAAANFYYAYALSRGGEIGSMDEHSVDLMRGALESALVSDPEHIPAMQLLAGLDLATENRLPEAESLMRKATSLRPRDEQLQLMLARILLRRERYNDASLLATRLKSSTDAQITKGAVEILDVSADYRKASADLTLKPDVSLPWEQPIVFLKRSWVSEDEIAAIERDRNNNNLNVLLGAMRPGEKRILTNIARIECSAERINYYAPDTAGPVLFTSPSFERVRMSVLLEGSHSFKLDCGTDLSKDLAVLTYAPSKSPTDPPVLSAIAFVPPEFVLLTPQQISAHRMVVVHDDELRSRDGVIVGRDQDPSADSRLQSIKQELRKPQDGESQVLGTISHVGCGPSSFSISVSAGPRPLTLDSKRGQTAKVRWFTTETTQAVLNCGSDAMVPNALVTYLPRGDSGGELRAIEFVPRGLGLSDSRR